MDRQKQLDVADREISEKSEGRKDEEKDDGNHSQPHPWRQGRQEENRHGEESKKRDVDQTVRHRQRAYAHWSIFSPSGLMYQWRMHIESLDAYLGGWHKQDWYIGVNTVCPPAWHTHSWYGGWAGSRQNHPSSVHSQVEYVFLVRTKAGF